MRCYRRSQLPFPAHRHRPHGGLPARVIGGPNVRADALKLRDDPFATLVKTKEFTEFMTKSDYTAAYKSSAETKAFVQAYNADLLKDAKFMDEHR